jgi:pimeloyl-ACP methyl ester carboxylesterase
MNATSTPCLSLTVSAVLAAGAGCTHDTASARPATAATHGTIAVNGIDYYYEVQGTGEPLVFLHGGLMSIDLSRGVITALAAHRQVIAVELQGHGHTTLGDRAISLADIGDDVATIIKQLGHDQVDVMGYSMGGGVAFRLAVQHPDAVRRLVLVSTPFSQEGFYPEMLPLQAQVGAAMLPMMKETPMYTSYVAVAPRPDDFPRLLDAMGALMRKPYNWADDVKRVTAQTLLVYGDSDMFRPEHEVEFYKLLGGGQRDAGWQRETMAKNRLAIISDATHYEMMDAPLLVPTVTQFLE